MRNIVLNCFKQSSRVYKSIWQSSFDKSRTACDELHLRSTEYYR